MTAECRSSRQPLRCGSSARYRSRATGTDDFGRRRRRPRSSAPQPTMPPSGGSPSQLLATLPIDVDLEAIAKEGQWYLVRLPEKFTRCQVSSSASCSRVVFVSCQGRHHRIALRPRRRAASRQRSPPPASPVLSRSRLRLLAWWFLANDSFNAVLGHRGGFLRRRRASDLRPLVRRRRIRALQQHGAARDRSGRRRLLPLGIADTITMEPLTVSGGYRFKPNGKSVACRRRLYVAAIQGDRGICGARRGHRRTLQRLRHPGRRRVRRAQVGVRLGRGALHRGPERDRRPGVAAEFNESNLGGFSVALKVSVGN